MKFISKKQTVALVFPLILFLLACNALAPGRDPYLAPVFATAPAPLVTDTVAPALSQQVTLVSVPFNESDPGNGYPKYTITAQTPQLTDSDDPRVLAFNQRLNESDPGNGYPKYTITAQTPQLTDSDDPRVLAFNQRLNDLVANEVNVWRQEFQRLPLTPLSNGSSLDVTYTLVGQRGDVWSFKFDFSFYADTAAHPGLNSTTMNYDLGQGKELALKDLFLPNSEFLEEIAYYSMEEIKKQPYADSFWLDGAQPIAENYRLWNIAPEGLMITFSQYQVAPGASGPMTVIVPYSALSTIIDPTGPLAMFLP